MKGSGPAAVAVAACSPRRLTRVMRFDFYIEISIEVLKGKAQLAGGWQAPTQLEYPPA